MINADVNDAENISVMRAYDGTEYLYRAEVKSYTSGSMLFFDVDLSDVRRTRSDAGSS
jgi:hypothetical protein